MTQLHRRVTLGADTVPASVASADMSLTLSVLLSL